MNRTKLLFLLLLAGCASAPPRAPVPAALPRAGAAAAATGEEDAAVPIASRNPTWGSRTAPVTIVEFADFQCGFCARAERTLAQVRAAYGPQSVRIVWKDAPLDFHAEAHPTAEAAAAVFELAGVDAFWKFHDAALSDQRDLGVDSSVKWAREAGADADVVRKGLASRRWMAPVDADVADAGALGVTGTPTFFVNGVRVIGAQPFEVFKAVIDEQLKAAQAKLAAGTPADAVYRELTRAALAVAPKPDEPEDEPEDTKTVFKVPLGSSPQLGPPTALVTVVEFADYQCPYCGRAEETLKALRAKYGDKLRVVYKDEPLPFHQRAEPAAEAAAQVREEKGDGAYWQMHDALYGSQDKLDDETLVRIGAQLGARPDRLRASIEKHTHRAAIEDDLGLADDLGADGTPHFFIDGRRLVGAQPAEKFAAIIDEELAKASALVAKGTKPADVYDALTRDGQGPPPPLTHAVPSSLPAGDPVRGAAKAKVTVHEWSDYECPFCARVEPVLKQLMLEYQGRIRLVWHDLPLPMHTSAPLAARATREAQAQRGEAAYWSLHDTIFEHQKELGRAALDGWAKDLHLEASRWGKALDGTAHQAEVEADQRAAEELGIRGTPGFLIVAQGATQGYVISGAQPYPRFRKLVDRALAEAK